MITAAIYLYNQTFYALNKLKSLYKSFPTYIFNKNFFFESRKPQFYYLKAYRCKAYILIKSKKSPEYYCKL